jgi:D-hydroxyproline dehydrogenase subunit gamma
VPEPERFILLTIDGRTIRVPEGTTIAAAVLISGAAARISISGERRGPLCGMGVCFECRVAIDGIPHQRSCQILCTPGIRVTTLASESTESPGGRQMP